MGFHLSQLVYQIFVENWDKSDFLEMLLHHAVTVYYTSLSEILTCRILVRILVYDELVDWCACCIPAQRRWRPNFLDKVLVWDPLNSCYGSKHADYGTCLLLHENLRFPIAHLFILFQTWSLFCSSSYSTDLWSSNGLLASSSHLLVHPNDEDLARYCFLGQSWGYNQHSQEVSKNLVSH